MRSARRQAQEWTNRPFQATQASAALFRSLERSRAVSRSAGNQIGKRHRNPHKCSGQGLVVERGEAEESAGTRQIWPVHHVAAKRQKCRQGIAG